ncbi:hypothetical protein B0H67DRAFT_477236 [Lasiosphaeris hirsuta]|uniref:Homeobox domain-containing protein n=1 Tax=Lasiosphaeris hirsuta TaxID=260670 RepID=A0AA40BBI1_9PEZI|nr:hypothetical protein B0H67DRAFT_477236 [Lasiosphaeris hirsuta]
MPSSPSHSPELPSHDRPSSSSSNPRLPTSSSVLGSDALTHTPESERHPKGKRKRTAAKDKTILEAAYTANPKPDKAARLAIVNRVSLNEKEVQIWFQNRRQNDRRKSRPLSPQEIAALRYGGMQILSSDPVSFDSSFSSDNLHTSPTESMSQLDRSVASPLHSDPASSTSDEAEINEPPQETSRDTQHGEDPESSEPREAATPPPKRGYIEERALGLSRSFSSSVGYLSNRWNPASSFTTPSTLGRRGDDFFKLEPFAPSTCSSSASDPALPPTGSQSSQFRLSLSLEGKAEVVHALPSPPRPTIRPQPSDELPSLGPVRCPGLQRSHSASPTITLPPISVLTSSLPTAASGALPPRLTRGRSRDVHAWEFCCDAENREDFLTVQAKHESSGSAIAAISLLRSTSSNGSPLQQSSGAKRNATLSKAVPRSDVAKKPKLGRALSSMGKLQTSFGNSEKGSTDKKVDVGLDKTKILSPSGNESDKENWSPDEEGNPRFPIFQAQPASGPIGRRPLPSGTTRLDKNSPRRTPPRRTPSRLLQDRRSPGLLFGSRANTAPVFSRKQRAEKGSQPPLEIYEDSWPPSPAAPVLDEVERFMRGQVSPSKKGDVDAIAGLLSLSQGNWR